MYLTVRLSDVGHESRIDGVRRGEEIDYWPMA